MLKIRVKGTALPTVPCRDIDTEVSEECTARHTRLTQTVLYIGRVRKGSHALILRIYAQPVKGFLPRVATNCTC
jgi:hypothetical protein